VHELPPWSARTASAIARPIVRKVTPPYACLTSMTTSAGGGAGAGRGVFVSWRGADDGFDALPPGVPFPPARASVPGTGPPPR
jgi:hypothetical protein